jgi:hypothetical protein
MVTVAKFVANDRERQWLRRETTSMMIACPEHVVHTHGSTDLILTRGRLGVGIFVILLVLYTVSKLL